MRPPPAKAHSYDDAALSTEEARQFEKAFSDDEFRNLLAEYVAELSDPSHKEEQEAYIAQLEAQNELPSGKALIWPSSGFVVKIMHRKKRAKGNDEEKLFLNIVHSEKVAKPRASNSDNGGSTWSIPYSLGPLRMERDKSGANLVATFDCCFHPLSLRHAHARKEFLDLAINIATDAVENSFAKSGDKVKITKGYTILRGVTYKSGTPKALLVSHGDEKEGVKNNVPSREVPRAVVPGIAAETLAPLISKTASRTVVPKYQIVERGVFDISDHTKNPLTQSERPKYIIVRVYLDKSTTTATNINLDVSEKELKIHPNAKCRYDLKVELPYPVNPQEGNAHFDTKQSALIVQLPVLPCIK